MKPSLSQQGFTLVEILIVTLILSLVMFSGTYAYSLFTRNWDAELGHFQQSNSLAMGVSRLEHMLANISPYVIRTDQQQGAFLFVGGRDSLLAVTHDGLFNTSHPEVFRLSIIENPDGSYQLLYQARTMENFAIISESQNIEFEQQIVLLDKLSNIEFSYYGWSSFIDKVSQSADNLVGGRNWYTVYSGIDKQIPPEKIRVTITLDKKALPITINLDNSAERWLRAYSDED